MKKNMFIMILVFSFFCFINNINAKEIYYTNKKNVSFTKEEYDFLSLMYWDGCQDLMTDDDYNKFIDSDIMNGIISVNVSYPIMLCSDHIETNSKVLKIAKSCSTNCLISVTATWKNEPNVRSYDVIGAYLYNTKLVNTPSTSVVSSNGVIYSNELQEFDNGFGVSIKLPTTASSLIVNQTYRVNTGGQIYASYQHATSTISLSNSKKYTISPTGFGGVFTFNGIGAEVYDQMRGVDIEL